MSNLLCKADDDNRARLSGGLFVPGFGVVLALLGFAMAVPGLRLVQVGGSWYYALAGLALIVCGALYVRRDGRGFWLFAALFAASLAWAIWEAGLKFWPQVPRVLPWLVLTVPAALAGAMMLRTGKSRRMARITAAVSFGAVIAMIAAMFHPHGVVRAAWQPPLPADAATSPSASSRAAADWRHFGRSSSGTRYVPANELTRENVGELRKIWEFDYGEPPTGSDQDQNTPLVVDGTLFHCSARNVVHALDAETGARLWRFDPEAFTPDWARCRGLGYFEKTTGDPASACFKRIILTTVDARLIALDAADGAPCRAFGNGGTVDLKAHIGEAPPGYYYPTSGPTVAGDRIVVGAQVKDGQSSDEPSGVVRAFDAETGALVWAFDVGNPAITTVPPEGETYTRGTPNVWGPPAFDADLGLVYLPTANPTPDHWGGNRSAADEAYGSSIVAVDLETGRERWRFQTVHHDVWNYDVSPQPILTDFPDPDGGTRPALVQLTKRGQIFVLDRRNGTPITAVEERPVPQGAPDGDFTAPTQPYSTGMPGIGTEPLNEARMWGITPFDHLYCRIKFRLSRYEGDFTPMSARTILFPGNLGGMNWASGAVDTKRGLLIVNDIRMAEYVRLIRQDDAAGLASVPSYEWFLPQKDTPFAASAYHFFSPLGIPCNEPPFGTISAIDLGTKQIVWQIPAGTIADFRIGSNATGMPIPIGMPTLGGPVATAGGLLFHAGTQDHYLRAYDIATGDELWKGRLPFGTQATPVSYVSPKSGRQFVAVTTGGFTDGSGRGSMIVAFARPKNGGR